MLRKSLSAGLCAVALGLVAQDATAQSWPERPITMIVPWAAGGGTDATARQVAQQLQEALGTPVNVVNRTGGGGVVGHTAIATAPPDGYTIGVVTFEITTYHWQGLSDLSHEDFTALAQYNFDPAGLQVSADSPYDTAMELFEAVRDNPGEFRASTAGGHGTGWQLAMAGLMQRLDINPMTVNWVPGQGAAPALQELVAGGIEIVPCSIPEAAALIEAGRVRSLLVMAEDRIGAFPDVPTAEEATGIGWTGGSWRGIVAPRGIPDEVVDRIVPVLQDIYESEAFQDFMERRGFGLAWRGPDEFAAFMAEADANTGQLLRALELAQ